MPSYLAWIDFSEEDRQKMLDVVRLFNEHDTRDELGIGTIRDAFADYFFPGTSTIQTRARYMLFVPWIYRELERKRVPSAQIADKARIEETNLIKSLLQSDDDDKEGIIGRDAGRKLKRLPSNIYWSGLGIWGIRLYQGSQEQYHRYLDKYYRYRRFQEGRYSEKSDLDDVRENWDPGMPDPPAGFPNKAEMKLRPEEAEYLIDRILCRHGKSLLAYCVTALDEVPEVDFFWELPLVQSLPEELQRDIYHARNFSEAIYGASLLYNLLLSRAKGNSELITEYSRRLEDWTSFILNRWEELNEWHGKLNDFWDLPAFFLANIPAYTKFFVENWFRIIFGGGIHSLSSNKEAEELIRDREFRLKRSRARLENKRALEMWGGASGDYRLDYRWFRVSIIIADILSGLARKGEKEEIAAS